MIQKLMFTQCLFTHSSTICRFVWVIFAIFLNFGHECARQFASTPSSLRSLIKPKKSHLMAARIESITRLSQTSTWPEQSHSLSNSTYSRSDEYIPTAVFCPKNHIIITIKNIDYFWKTIILKHLFFDFSKIALALKFTY